ncbi:MAG: SIS domain-containing protein [Candidatus Thermoplasmatota archaeon]|nr:SIS domain-containing protein [Candidatus Thermoplasmatota archaeon]
MNKKTENKILKESIDCILDTIDDSLEDLELDKINRAVDILTSSDHVFIYGSGRSGLVGRTFAMRLMQLGLNSFFIGETITPAVQDGDCVFLVSKTGETQTAIQAARIVENRVPKAEIIVVTASPDSTLAEFGDINIILDIKDKEEDQKLAPLGTIFEDSAMIFLDGLVSVLMEDLDEEVDDMKYRHPILI